MTRHNDANSRPTGAIHPDPLLRSRVLLAVAATAKDSATAAEIRCRRARCAAVAIAEAQAISRWNVIRWKANALMAEAPLREDEVPL